MGSFADCIESVLSQGKISKAVADQLKRSSDPAAELDNIVAGLSLQKREAAVQAARLASRWKDVTSHPLGAYEGLLSLLTKDRTGKSGYANIEYLARFYQGKYHSQLADMLQRFRTRKLGFSQDAKGLNDLVRSIYGEPVQDADLNAFAKDWSNVVEGMRKDFNSKGGYIGQNVKWLMPQNHDFRAIEKAGLDKWKQYITPKLDRTQMLDDAGKQLSDEELDKALDFVFDSITTHGLNKVNDFSIPRLGTKLTKRHAEKRFLFFKDADSWLNYQKDYGKGDIFTTLTDFVDNMAHDIAKLEMLGPSPDNTFKALFAQADKAQKLTGVQKNFLNAVYNNVSGKTNAGELTGFADFMQSTRNVLTASTLGRAFLSSFTDLGFQFLTSRYNSIPALKVVQRHMSLMTNEQAQVFAVRMGLTAEAMIGRMTAANRYADTYGVGVTAKAAEGVMRGSLLSPWTDAGRKAFGMEFGATLAENFGKSINQLDPNMQRAFKEYGITAAEWDAFRQTKPLEYEGAKFADMTQPGGVKFHQMVMSETDFAVPTPDAKVRAVTNGGLERATIQGQAWRSAMMLKSFPATIIMTHFYRMAYQATFADKVKYMGAMLASTSILGGVALQMKDITAGKDPRPIDGKFALAAIQQGGGLGILGDFVFSDVNRFGAGITQTLTGPTGELIDTTVKFTLGNVREALSGEETNVLGESVKILDRYTPDVWQTYLFSNALFDQLELLADPKAAQKFRRIMRKRETEYDQGYWWKEGKAIPERAPDLSNATKNIDKMPEQVNFGGFTP